MTPVADHAAAARFRSAYAAQRAAEGRRLDRAQLHTVPYLTSGPLVRQWQVRARTYDTFVRRVLLPDIARLTRPLRLLDLGAGNGWLSHRAALAGCDATSVDIRDDDVDGLGAAKGFLDAVSPHFWRVAGSFEALPIASAAYDMVVFNASLHYATDLALVLQQARRVLRPGGRLVILDSPFYRRAEDGQAMVAEKRREAATHFGARADELLTLPFIEYLTSDMLRDASRGLALHWRRWRVRYPLWYEWRGVSARLHGRRPPSRFDIWESPVV